MSQSSAEYLLTLVVILAVTVLPLAAWDGLRALGRRIADWADRTVNDHVTRALDDPATRPMQYWRPTTSLDAAQDRHRANGEES